VTDVWKGGEGGEGGPRSGACSAWASSDDEGVGVGREKEKILGQSKEQRTE
jgi:hypothetical protein